MESHLLFEGCEVKVDVCVGTLFKQREEYVSFCDVCGHINEPANLAEPLAVPASHGGGAHASPL